MNKLLFPSLLFISLCVLTTSTSFYDILEVTAEADDKTIKKSFRKLSLKYHPDKNPDNHEMFLKINKAYETLMDPEKRKIYDIYGEEGLNQPMQPHDHKQKGPSARLDIHVELEELYNGAIKELSIQKNVVCSKCHGTGGKLGKTRQCPQCSGRGVVLQEVNTGMGFTMRMQNQCPRCAGKGITFTETCESCRGRKVIKEDKKLRIDVEKGMQDHQTIVFERESEQHPDMIPGDLIVTIKQNPHKFFTSRRENDLYATFGLNLKEALLGYSKKIVHLDKREFYIEDNKPTQPFWVRKIDNEGMPVHKYPSQKGNLFVKLEVRLPERLSDEEKDLVRQLFN
jgi:DnaJ-related protein SCJ1